MRGMLGSILGMASLCDKACVQVGQQQEPPWRLVTLSPLPDSAARDTGSADPRDPVDPAIGVGPIHIPDYLDQDQLVTRVSDNQVILSENVRWAESLPENIAQVLAHNLATLLPGTRVLLYPWPALQSPNYQVDVNLVSFETDTAGTTLLAARWLLRDLAGRQTLMEKETRLTEPAAGGSAEQSVASLSRALADFSAEVAKAICDTAQQCRPRR